MPRRILFAAVLAAFAAGAAQAQDAMPAGVTLKVVRIGQGIGVPGSNSNQPRDRIIFADSKGATLYASDKDQLNKSACDAECAKTWPPFLAPAGAKPAGDWTLLAHPGTAGQWAFRGKPMYTYAKDGGLVARGGSGETGDVGAARAPAFSASANGHGVDGRATVELEPEDWMSLPSGIIVQEVRTAPGQVLTTERGMAIYAFSGKAGDTSVSANWVAVAAPQLSLPVGDFTVIPRADGLHQWSFRGKALYTFKGDFDSGDSNGKYADKRFQVAQVMPYFTPAGVKVRKNHAFGGLLTTADDRTLYVRENGIDGADGAQRAERGNPNTGMTIGVSSCDAACEKTWQPLIAPDTAQPAGYWTVFNRPDGKKQWGYYGYAMYTYAEEKPGEMNGHLIYDDVDNYEALPNGGVRPYLRLRWRVAPP